MKTLQTVEAMRVASADARRQGKSIGFVPTMGALHEGHLSLVRAARERCDVVVASIFVNPTQFGPGEDFAGYPRTLESDSRQLAAAKVDLLFAPSTAEMYPPGATTFVDVEGLSERLDGKSRPGHFRGVTTVVNKLFHVVQPDLAFFGQKDAAQVAVIQKMVRDLRIPVDIIVCPIVREADGLAMSSRNAYLSAAQRGQALVFHRALRSVLGAYEQGERSIAALRERAQGVFAQEKSVVIDYIEIVDPATLEPRGTHAVGGELVAIAAKVGATRLIDNIVLPK
ncbi:MAG: pantoate--beta-alanine ligase [Terriglobales bacterium]